MRHLTLFTWILLLGIPLQAEESEFPKEESAKILTIIQTQLKTLFEKSKLDVGTEIKDGKLTSSLNTMEFMVHHADLLGRYHGAGPEEGPNHGGVLLELKVAKGRREGRQASFPTTFSAPYWEEYRDIIPINNEHGLCITIKYATGFDLKVVEEIKRIAADALKKP